MLNFSNRSTLHRSYSESNLLATPKQKLLRSLSCNNLSNLDELFIDSDLLKSNRENIFKIKEEKDTRKGLLFRSLEQKRFGFFQLEPLHVQENVNSLWKRINDKPKTRNTDNVIQKIFIRNNCKSSITEVEGESSRIGMRRLSSEKINRQPFLDFRKTQSLFRLSTKQDSEHSISVKYDEPTEKDFVDWDDNDLPINVSCDAAASANNISKSLEMDGSNDSRLNVKKLFVNKRRRERNLELDLILA